MLFEWYWVFLYLVILRHIHHVVFTLYFHRGNNHGLFEFSESSSAVCRTILWLNEAWWPNWNREAWWSHRYHHDVVDSDLDPHNPRKFSLLDIVHIHDKLPKFGDPWFVPEEWKKLNPNPHQPLTDRLEEFFNKHRYFGPRLARLLIGIIAFLLFGVWAGILAICLWTVLCKYGNSWSAIFPAHGVHTCKWLNYKSPYATNKLNGLAVNYFPIGILHAGEEYHSNHHTKPWQASNKHRWWELDIGYVYACILEPFGLIKIKR